MATAREVVSAFTGSVMELLEATPSVEGNRPIDIARGLGVNMKLAWKMSHLATVASALDAVRHIPGSQGIRIVRDAAATHGCPEAICARLNQTFVKLQEFISAQAGSRRAFESMIAGVEESRDRRLEAELRRQLFEGGTSVWGIRAGCYHRLDALSPSRTTGLLDCSTLRSFIDVRRLRGGVSMNISRAANIDDGGIASQPAQDEPLDASVSPGSFPLIHAFSSGEVPVFQAQEHPYGLIDYVANRQEHADSAPFSIATGEVLRAVQPIRVSKRHHGIFQLSRLRIPTEQVLFDILVHKDLLRPNVQPEAYLAGDMQSTSLGIGALRRERLPVQVTVREVLGKLSKVMVGDETVESRMKTAIAPLDAEIAEFNWYRLEVTHPPIPTSLAFECELPS
ncbi:MAG: hypothetical protein MK085_06465 [Phycisphaerales bacterium]|nr:hypothetical protein [Phycisphaerales bacterium]